MLFQAFVFLLATLFELAKSISRLLLLNRCRPPLILQFLYLSGRVFHKHQGRILNFVQNLQVLLEPLAQVAFVPFPKLFL
ncbi:unnamed protein product [Meloidogyne enterolobii]|uniref:Uncharacterized protein n=1 Tax=Meloidogyne enterolobii TaxID=390850 RepID=A0ACB0YLT6_MELEN